MVFDAYAQYYNLLYKDKQYTQEAEYVLALINKYGSQQPKSLLDIGCGTGNHDIYFSKTGIKVLGIDAAPEMIKIAKQKENDLLSFQVADATNFSLSKTFDVVVSLFHVINYHITNDLLNKAFANVAQHLKKGNLFIFDSWYGPAVLSEKPVLRTKILENAQVKVTRIATPTLFPNENRVSVNYNISVQDKKSLEIQNISEEHKVRYLFKPEIEALLFANSLELIHSEEWLTGKEPGFDTWGVCFVVRKK